MKKIKLSILGCCVSREVFNYSNDFEIASAVYSSFISLFENKIDVSLSECSSCISPQFQARNTYLELNKTVFEYLKQQKGDYLILDFGEVVNEFYNIENEDGNIVTRVVANPYIKEILTVKGYKFSRVSSMNCDISFIVKNLFDKLFDIYPRENILLNKVSFSRFFYLNNSICKFLNHYRLTQNNLKKVRVFEDEAEKYLDKCNVFQPVNNVLSNGEHKYGCSPVHYFDEDYYFMAHRFREKFGLINDKLLYMSYVELFEKERCMLLRNIDE